MAYLGSQTPTEEIAHSVVLRRATCACTTGLQSSGAGRCRRPQLFQPQRQNTTRYQQLLLKSCTFKFATSSRAWASPNKLLLRSMRTTPRVLNGETTSSGRERAKHIDIRKHYANEVIQNVHMLLIRVPTVFHLADILTKSLHFPQWQACVAGILSKKVGTT